jgi:hypothetical protein
VLVWLPAVPAVVTPILLPGHDYDLSGVFATNPREAPGQGTQDACSASRLVAELGRVVV